MKKRQAAVWILILVLALVPAVTACEERSSGKTVTGSVGDALTCTFFEFTVTNVDSAEELDGYTPAVEGNKFVTADLTVRNIGDQSIPVGNYDFTILWESDEEIPEGADMAYEVFMDGMYPNDVALAPGESESGTLVFDVPADVDDFSIVYQEIWDDNFEGDTYMVECSLKQ